MNTFTKITLGTIVLLSPFFWTSQETSGGGGAFAQQNTFIYGVCKGTSIVPADIIPGTSNVAVHQVPSDSGYIAFGEAGYIMIVNGKSYTYNAFSATKLDKNANLQWTRVYKDTNATNTYAGYTRLHDGIPVADGGFVMAGGKAVTPKDYYWKKNSHVQKIDRNGHKVWSKVYELNNNNENWALKILQMNDGGFIVMGVTKDATYSVNGINGSIWNANSSYNTYLLRLDGNGNTMWCYEYDADKYGEEEPKSLDITDDGGFIIGGKTNNDSVVDGFITDPKLSYTKAFMMKVSADGATVEWAKRYGAVFKGFPFYGDYFNEVKQTPGGGYIATGSTGGDDGDEGWMVKTNALGVVEWQKTGGSIGGSIELLSDGYMMGNGGSMAKISLTGEVEWVKSYALLSDNGIPGSYSGDDYYFGRDRINATMDGGFVMSHVSSYYLSYDYDSQYKIIIKTNASGELENSCYYDIAFLASRVVERTDTLYTLMPGLVNNASPVNSIVVEDSITEGIAYCPVACDPKRAAATVAPRLINGTNVCANTDASICIVPLFTETYNDDANYHHYTIDFGDPESGTDNYYVSTLGITDRNCFQHNYTTPGTYTLTMVVYNSDNSESDAAYALVYVHPAPVITLLTPEVRVCSKDTVTLTARIENYIQGLSSLGWKSNYYSFLSVNNLPDNAGIVKATVVPDSSVDYYAIVMNEDYNVNCPVVSDTARVITGDNEAVITGNTTICKGGSTTLKASGGDVYLWSTGAITGAITVSPGANKTYWVEARTVDGCRDTAYVYVQVAQEINVEAFADRHAVCTGDQVTLYATGAANYAWGNGGNTDTIRIAAADGPNTYLVTGTSGSCTDTASVVITGDAKPAGMVSGPSSPVCQDITYTLTASGGDRYYWTTGFGFDRTNPAHEISLGNASTMGGASVNIYKGGCSTTVEYNVSIYKPDNTLHSYPDIGGILADECRVCPGTEVTLRKYFYFSSPYQGGVWIPHNASSPENEGLTYQWSTGYTGVGQDDSIKVTVIKDTIITLITTNKAGCSITSSVAIQAKPYFYIKKEADSIPSCLNSPTTLYLLGEPLEDFTWENGSKNDTLVYQPPADEWFTITGAGNGCTRTDSVWVEAKPNLPEASIHGDSIVCQGFEGTYTAFGEIATTGFDWLTGNPADNLSSITLPISKDTTIKAVVSFTGGCNDTAEYKIKVINKPQASISGDTLLCSGGTTLLKASGGYIYGWSTGNTGKELSLTPAIDEVIRLYAFAGNCSDTATVTIRTDQSITATIFSDEDTICSGTALTLIAGGGDNYTWNTGEKGEMLGISPGMSATYAVVVTTNGNCSDTESITINVIASPTLSVSGPSSICSGESAVLNASGSAANFLWSTGATTASITVMPGNDSIFYVASTSEGCTDSIGHTITVVPSTSISAGAGQTILSGTEVTLEATGGNNYSWSTLKDGLLCDNCNSLLVNPVKTTTYYVTETNAACSEDSVTIYVLNCSELTIPNAFSPNGDQVNDVLFLQNDCIKELDFKIYDRWGNTVFQTAAASLGWDGTYKGRMMDVGVFVYYINATVFSGEVLTQKGNVSLIR